MFGRFVTASKILTLALFAAIIVLAVPATTLSQTSPTINYQAKLTDATGLAVADGTYNMRFWLIDSPSNATTTADWSEVRTGANRVQVTNGLFSVMLGEVTSLTGVDFNQVLYLGVEIGGTGGSPAWDGEMSPRKILGTVPAAFEARQLGGVASSSFLRSDAADTASGLLTFTGGLISSASSTITDLTTVTATTTNLVINGERFTDLTGFGLANNSGVLSVATSTLGLSSAFSNSAQLAALLSDETGSGAAVFGTNPILSGAAISSTTLSGLTTFSGLTASRTLFLDASSRATTTALSASLLNSITDETGSGALVFGTSPTFTTSANFGTAGVRLSDDGDGALTFLGLGNGSDEDLTLNLDDTANTGVFTSSTGLNRLTFTDMGINISSSTQGLSLGGNSFLSAAGSSNTNIRLGLFAGNSLSSSALGNTIVGYLGGTEITTGGDNTLIGNFAGYNASSTNSSNTYIGSRAASRVIGNYSTIVGAEAFSGIGLDADEFLSTNNTALGYRAGYNATNTADNNIIIGYQAADNLTTGNNNIIIGYDIDNVTATADNRLNIGNLLFGTGLDGTGTTLASGNIGIGTSSPSQKLTVDGNARITGALFDSNNASGTTGMVLQSTGVGTQWVATSTLGISGVSTLAALSDTTITGPATGQILSYNGSAWANVATSTLGLSAAFSNSAQLAALLSDETGSGSVVFSESPTFTNLTGNNPGLTIAVSSTTNIGLLTEPNEILRGTDYYAIVNRITDLGSSGSMTVNTNIRSIDNYIDYFETSVSPTTNFTAYGENTQMAMGSGGTQTFYGNNVSIVGIAADSGTSTAYGFYSAIYDVDEAFAFYAESGKSFFQDNVGIGTTSPNSRLSIVPLADATTVSEAVFGNAAIGFSNSSETAFAGLGYINSVPYFQSNVSGSGSNLSLNPFGGNIGVGTTTPEDLFSIAQQADSNGLRINGFDDESDNSLRFYVNNFGYGVIDSDELLQFDSNTGSRILSLYGNGATFNELGSAALDFRVEGDTETNLLFIDAGLDRVGIGTSSPVARFSVTGDSFLSGSLRLTGTFNDSSGDAGTNGQVLLSTGTGTNWVATSTLGFGSAFSNSAQLAALLSDETGTGNVVFSDSPTLTGTTSMAAATLSSNLTLSGSAANINLGNANYLSPDGSDIGIWFSNNSSAKFTASSGSAIQFAINNTSTAVNSSRVLNFESGASSAEARIISQIMSASNSDLIFETRGGSTAERMRLTSTGNLGIGTTTPAARLSLERTSFSTNDGVAALDQWIQTTGTTNAGTQFGNRFNLTNNNTATSTIVGSIIRVADSTSLGNTVRALEVQSNRGTNTAGENTAISGTGRTFGIRGITEGDAGGTFEPAGGFFQTRGTTQGNAIRGYSESITSAALLSLFQASSTFTGTGLEMSFGNTTGSFSSTSSKFLDFQNAGTSVFTVSAFGTTTIGDGTNYASLQIGRGGFCVDNDGACDANVAGRMASVSTFAGNSDLAETYFSSQWLNAGEIVTLEGELSVERAEQGSATPIIGVVSTKPGLLLGYDDTSLTPGERSYPIALSGRVPIILSTENGPIRKGDQLMLSSIHGVAMKATSTGTVVGIALEDFDESRMYSETYVNQFTDDIANESFTPVTTVNDPRINDGCYFSGGTDAGTAPCVPLIATSSVAQIEEANEIARTENRERVIRELRAARSETRTTASGQSVKVGQVVMFVNLSQRWFADTQTASLTALFDTRTVENVGTNTSETLFDRLKTLANNFVDGVLSIFELRANRVEVREEICVDGVCLDADSLRQLLNEQGGATESSPEPTVNTVPTNPAPDFDSESESPSSPESDMLPPSDNPDIISTTQTDIVDIVTDESGSEDSQEGVLIEVVSDNPDPVPTEVEEVSVPEPLPEEVI